MVIFARRLIAMNVFSIDVPQWFEVWLQLEDRTGFPDDAKRPPCVDAIDGNGVLWRTPHLCHVPMGYPIFNDLCVKLIEPFRTQERPEFVYLRSVGVG